MMRYILNNKFLHLPLFLRKNLEDLKKNSVVFDNKVSYQVNMYNKNRIEQEAIKVQP